MPFLKTRTRYLAYFSSYGDLGAFWGLLGPKTRVSAAHSRFKPSQCPRQARRLGNGLGMAYHKTETHYLTHFLRRRVLGKFATQANFYSEWSLPSHELLILCELVS